MAQRLQMVVLRAPRAVRRVGPATLPMGSNKPPVVLAGKEAAAPRARTASRDVVFKELEISAEDPTLDQVRDYDRDENVVGVAPAMPVVLIKPMKSGSGLSGNAPKVSWGIEAVNATTASTEAGAGVLVAILDTGIDAQHPAFSGVELVERNFTSESGEDLDGHGTHCAGTVFGRDVDGTRIGVARGINKALIGKVLGEGGGSTETVYRAMQWAMSEGAHVISMSLGMDFPGYQQALVDGGFKAMQATSLALAGYRANVRLFDAISRMVTIPDGAIGGTIVVAATGNESQRPDYAVTVAPPAAGEEFMSIAALEKRDDQDKPFNVAYFSNEEGNFAAPGVDIWSAKAGGGLTALSGTSMATPHVAGVAALWAQQSVAANTFRAREVLQLVASAVDPLPYLARRDVGQGLVKAP